MKEKMITRFLSLCLFCNLAGEVTAQVVSEKKMITLPAEVVVDKIRGGMLGQFIGNMNGMQYEFKFYEKPGEVATYIPALPKGAETDDDTDFEWVYIYNMQKMRTAFIPYQDINTLWTKSINRGIWCANRYARYLMDLGIKPPMTGNVVFNPWAEFNVSGQFLCETFGLVAPAMPQTAAKIGLHYTRVAIEQEPAQTLGDLTSQCRKPPPRRSDRPSPRHRRLPDHVPPLPAHDPSRCRLCSGRSPGRRRNFPTPGHHPLLCAKE
jgi:hypothetical protein